MWNLQEIYQLLFHEGKLVTKENTGMESWAIKTLPTNDNLAPDKDGTSNFSHTVLRTDYSFGKTLDPYLTPYLIKQ